MSKMEQYKADLISILRVVVCQDGTAILANADWNRIWDFAKRNHLEAVVYTAAPKEWKLSFENEYFKMVVRTVRQTHLLEQIEQALSNASIHYGLQMGSLLKLDYPEVHLRFMSDMDLYIRPEDRAAIRIAMESIGGMFTGRESGDQQLSISVDYNL